MTRSIHAAGRAELRFPAAAVADVMHAGVVSCPPETELHDVARMMADHGIHFVVVQGLAASARGGEQLVWGAISAFDLVRAGVGEVDCTAGELASTELVSVDSSDLLLDAARRLITHEVEHALVVDTGSRAPMGVVSTLDLVRALGTGVAA